MSRCAHTIEWLRTRARGARSVGMGSLVAVCMVGVMAQAGCTRTIRTSAMPPSVILSIKDADHSGAGGFSMGVWVGDRVLTVLHTSSDSTTPPSEIGINSRYVEASLEESGNAMTYNALRDAHPTPLYLMSAREDWAIFRVGEASPFPDRAITIGAPESRLGETLYAVGYDARDLGGGLVAVPLKVVLVDEDARTKRPRLIAARYRSSVLGPGWSGSLVGRYLKSEDRWEFVGLVRGSTVMGGHDVVTIVSPPEDVLERFLNHRDVASASSVGHAGF